MRPRIGLAVAFATLLMAGSVLAQDAAPADGEIAPPAAADEPEDVLTWEELPADIRRLAEPLIGTTRPQAVLHVETSATPDEDFRLVDHGDILLRQTIRPAGLARITRPVVNGRKYGPAGATLWPGVGPDGDYWCWRSIDPANAFRRGNIYCYLDRDGDGNSERMMENPTWIGQLPSSRFQFLSLGHDEGVPESAGFEIEPGALGEFSEVVVLRFYGPVRGAVQEDGAFGPGMVEFELLTGADADLLSEVSRIRVPVDAHGKGQHHALNGIRLEIDSVNVDGSARVRLLSGLPEGRTLLVPPLTRELIVERLSEAFNPDGSPKADEGPPAGGS